MSSTRCELESYAERRQKCNQTGEVWISALRQLTVQVFPIEFGCSGSPRHATSRFNHVSHTLEKDFRAFVKAGRKIGGHLLWVVEVLFKDEFKFDGVFHESSDLLSR